MDDILNDLNLEKLNIKELTLLLNILQEIVSGKSENKVEVI